MGLPEFTGDGLLPSGDYGLTFTEFRESRLVRGPGEGYPGWDTAWRLHLVDNLEIMVYQLWEVGITEVFADGSFLEDKEHPNDIDGYFECDLRYLATGQLERGLNTLDDHKVWTWDHRERAGRTGTTRRLSFPCGTYIGSNSIRIIQEPGLA